MLNSLTPRFAAYQFMKVMLVKRDTGLSASSENGPLPAAMARSVERYTVIFFMLSYCLATFLVYYVPYARSSVT